MLRIRRMPRKRSYISSIQAGSSSNMYNCEEREREREREREEEEEEEEVTMEEKIQTNRQRQKGKIDIKKRRE